MIITQKHLSNTEYFPAKTSKDTIYLHHTAGSHRPDWVIDGWNQDSDGRGNKIRIATSYVIGGKSTRDGNSDFDGKVFEAFSADHWAHHLGIKAKNNTFLNQKSLGIEICNYGALTKTRDGRFFTYVKTEVPASMVVELESPFRGSKYFQAYTSSQLETLRKLLLNLSKRFGIDLSKGLKKEIERFELKSPAFKNSLERQIWLNKNGFTDGEGKRLVEDGKDGLKTQVAWSKYTAHPLELNTAALSGFPGIWSHTNVRADKNDVFPQKELLQLIKSL
jgi:hypothetical protein